MTRFRLTFLLAFLLLPLPVLADPVLEFEDPWSPPAPPGRTMAGYVVIHNHGDRDISVVEAESPGFARVEIHTMSMDDGVMRMRRLDELVIEAGDSVRLQPGGLHLMLFEPSATLDAGDSFELDLVDSDGQRHELTVSVRPRS